jgi:hypothetical protein
LPAGAAFFTVFLAGAETGAGFAALPGLAALAGLTSDLTDLGLADFLEGEGAKWSLNNLLAFLMRLLNFFSPIPDFRSARAVSNLTAIWCLTSFFENVDFEGVSTVMVIDVMFD